VNCRLAGPQPSGLSSDPRARGRERVRQGAERAGENIPWFSRSADLDRRTDDADVRGAGDFDQHNRRGKPGISASAALRWPPLSMALTVELRRFGATFFIFPSDYARPRSAIGFDGTPYHIYFHTRRVGDVKDGRPAAGRASGIVARDPRVSHSAAGDCQRGF